MSRRGRLTIFTILVLVSFVGYWLHYDYTRYEKAYARLTPGTSKVEVLRLFGRPGYTTKCSEENMWDETALDGKSAKCVEEFHYFSHVRVGEYVVGFDENDRAVTKYYESSP